MSGFAIYALSRGTGVPLQAREALRKVRELVEADLRRGVSVSIESTRIGLEGETRMCVEYKNPKDAMRAYERATVLVKGIDLVNLVAESCGSAPVAGRQKQEGEP